MRTPAERLELARRGKQYRPYHVVFNFAGINNGIAMADNANYLRPRNGADFDLPLYAALNYYRAVQPGKALFNLIRTEINENGSESETIFSDIDTPLGFFSGSLRGAGKYKDWWPLPAIIRLSNGESLRVRVSFPNFATSPNMDISDSRLVFQSERVFRDDSEDATFDGKERAEITKQIATRRQRGIAQKLTVDMGGDPSGTSARLSFPELEQYALLLGFGMTTTGADGRGVVFVHDTRNQWTNDGEALPVSALAARTIDLRNNHFRPLRSPYLLAPGESQLSFVFQAENVDDVNVTELVAYYLSV